MQYHEIPDRRSNEYMRTIIIFIKAKIARSLDSILMLGILPAAKHASIFSKKGTRTSVGQMQCMHMRSASLHAAMLGRTAPTGDQPLFFFCKRNL